MIVSKLLLISFILLTSGCVTTVDVSQVTDVNKQPEGIQYSLPQPFLMVTPKSDGTMTVEVIYLANSNRQYAIKTRSYLNKHSQTITLDGAFLTKFALKGEDSAVLQSLIESAAELEVTKIEKASEGDKKAAEDAAKAAKAAAEALVAANAKVVTLNSELTTLTSQLAAAKNIDTSSVTPEYRTILDSKILTLTLDIEDKKHQLSAAQLTLSELQSNAEKSSFRTGNNEDSAYGPVLFEIVQSGNGVTLVAIEDQKQFKTYTKPKKAKKPSAAFKVSFASPSDMSRRGARRLKLTSNRIVVEDDTSYECPSAQVLLEDIVMTEKATGAEVAGSVTNTVLTGGLDISLKVPDDSNIDDSFKEDITLPDGNSTKILKRGIYELALSFVECKGATKNELEKSLEITVTE